MTESENLIYEDQGKVIAVCGSKGGVGKTSIAVNLAIALSKTNADVAIVDGDFQFGNVSLALDMHPTMTIKEMAEQMNKLDEYSVMNYMFEHESGIQLLAAPSRPEYADLITPELIELLIKYLKKNFAYIIVDAGDGMDATTLKILDHADKILPVTTPDIASLKNTKLLIDIIQQLDMAEETELVLNRHNIESLIKADAVNKMLEINHIYYIPNNIKICSHAMNIGVPFVTSHSKTDVAKAVFKMAQSIVEQTQGRKPKKKGLGKIFSKA